MSDIIYEHRTVTRQPNGVLADIHKQHTERRAKLVGPPTSGNMIALVQRIAVLEAALNESEAKVEKLSNLIREAPRKYNFGPGLNPVLAIMQIVADHFRVSVEDLQSASRQKHLTQPRFIIYFLARKLTSLSSPKIGRDIGNRDHTSVIHGSKAFHTLVKFDPEFRAKAEACEEKVLSMMQPVGRAQE